MHKSLSKGAADKKNARGVSAVVAAVLFGVVGLCALLATVSEEALSKKGAGSELSIPEESFLIRALSLTPAIALEKLALKKLILEEEAPEEEVPKKESIEEEATQEEAPEEEAIDEEALAEEKAEEEVSVGEAAEEEVPAKPPLEAGAPAAKTAAPKKPVKRPAAKKRAPVRKGIQARTQEDLDPDEHNFDGDPEGHPKAEVASRPKLAEPARKAQGQPRSETASAAAPTVAEQEGPRGKQLMLWVPRLGLEDVLVRDSSDPAYLDREGIMHLSGSGFPYEPASNTYIAGHAEGYSTSRVPHAFRNLKDLKEGDGITLRDASGKTYHYRVYERLLVGPYDYWVTKPLRGRRIVSLQTCFPAPTFEKRLVVRGKLVGVGGVVSTE